MSLLYQPRTRSYLDLATGRAVTPREIVNLRDAFTVQKQSQFSALALDLADGRIGVDVWADRFAALLQEGQTTSFLFGRGGVGEMSDGDYDALLDLIEKQMPYVDGFASEVAAGKMTPAQIPARAEMYGGSVVEAHAVGHERSYGELELPYHPGDGSTTCMTACRCWVEIEEAETEWRVTWHTQEDAGVCPECTSRGNTWTPLVIE